MKVTLRKKKIAKGRTSLYLDFYPAITVSGKKSRREFLKIYTYDKPKTSTEKDHNKTAMISAEKIRGERELQLLNNQFGLFDRTNAKKDFIKYFKEKATREFDSTGNKGNWHSAYSHFVSFSGGQCLFEDVTEQLCLSFKEYLQNAVSFKDKKPLSKNTQSSYFAKLLALLKQATKDHLFITNPAINVDRLSEEETQREFLTLDELKRLYHSECKYPQLKQMAIFSCLTGLRYSDIEKLIWKDIQHSKSTGYFIRFRRKKTKGAETLPISDQTFELCGKMGNPDEKIFAGAKYDGHLNERIREWLTSEGISKRITFHCFRHTFATIQLNEGTDIYTVSKMLGHKNVKTTQIYTKIIDDNKKKAIARIVL